LATSYAQAGQSARAIEQLEKALELDPSLEIAYQRLGEIYIEQKDSVRLRQTLERYLKFMPCHIATQATLKKLDSQYTPSGEIVKDGGDFLRILQCFGERRPDLLVKIGGHPFQPRFFGLETDQQAVWRGLRGAGGHAAQLHQ